MELLQAISNVGLLRNENEDCVLTCTHPENENHKEILRQMKQLHKLKNGFIMKM